jgi:hypothetical protein
MAKAISKTTPKKRHIASTGALAATEIAGDVAAFTGIGFTAAQWEVVQQMLRRRRWQEDRLNPIFQKRWGGSAPSREQLTDPDLIATVLVDCLRCGMTHPPSPDTILRRAGRKPRSPARRKRKT